MRSVFLEFAIVEMGRVAEVICYPSPMPSLNRCRVSDATTDTTPDLTIPCPAVAELRVRVDMLNKVLAELVGRTALADSEMAGFWDRLGPRAGDC